MSLMLPYPGGGLTQHNLSATPSSTAPGTTVTAHASVNTKGNWTQLIASANFDAYGVTLLIASDTPAAVAVANLYDIGIGANPNEAVVISNYPNVTTSNITGTHSMFIPVFIPKGSRVSCRKQSNTTAQTGSVVIFLHGGFSAPPWKSFAGAEAIGVDTADSGGVTHVPGSTGSESTWADLGSPTSRQYGALIPRVLAGSDTITSSGVGHVEFGINSVTLAEFIFVSTTAEAMGPIHPSIPIYGNFPASTQFMVRAEMQGTPDDNYEFALMGLF
jgi:hypothetical protein